MRITEVEIRACSPGAVATAPGGAVDGARLRGGSAPEVVVLSVRTDEGVTGVSFGSGGLDARITARALLTVSSHSLCGTESATTPQPACACSWPSLMTAVRMAMAMSIFPSQPR